MLNYKDKESFIIMCSFRPCSRYGDLRARVLVHPPPRVNPHHHGGFVILSAGGSPALPVSVSPSKSKIQVSGSGAVC